MFDKKTYQREWCRKRRKALMEWKKCSICWTTKNLENHHVDKNTKITHKFITFRKEFVDNEMKKCIQLCKKHHDELHAKEKEREITHWTDAGYARFCRCDLCTKAHYIRCLKYRNPWNNS
jgi:hypothetical protein